MWKHINLVILGVKIFLKIVKAKHFVKGSKTNKFFYNYLSLDLNRIHIMPLAMKCPSCYALVSLSLPFELLFFNTLHVGLKVHVHDK